MKDLLLQQQEIRIRIPIVKRQSVSPIDQLSQQVRTEFEMMAFGGWHGGEVDPLELAPTPWWEPTRISPQDVDVEAVREFAERQIMDIWYNDIARGHAPHFVDDIRVRAGHFVSLPILGPRWIDGVASEQGRIQIELVVPEGLREWLTTPREITTVEFKQTH